LSLLEPVIGFLAFLVQKAKKHKINDLI